LGRVAAARGEDQRAFARPVEHAAAAGGRGAGAAELAAEVGVNAAGGPDDQGHRRRGESQRGEAGGLPRRGGLPDRGGVALVLVELLLDKADRPRPLAAGDDVLDELDQDGGLVAALEAELAAQVAELAELSAAEAEQAAAGAQVADRAALA